MKKKWTTTGTIDFQYQLSTDTKCVCCPNGRHAYCRTIAYTYESDFPQHFGKDAELFARQNVCKHENVGKKVRITVELLEE